MIVVAYPENEDPFETRERVRRKEQPNVSWRFYAALFKYESDNFSDAELWIAMKEHGPVEEVKDTEPDKALKTVKPCNNPRKPLPRILIRRITSNEIPQGSNQNRNNKCLKLDKNPEPVVITDHTTASGSSKRKQPVITSNQVIQKNQKKTNYASNGEINAEKSSQPEVIKENQSVGLLVPSTSAKLLVEQQQLQPPTEQQLSIQPPTGREPSPQPPIDRQPSPKLKRYADETHIIYQPIAPNEVNIQFPAHYLSSQSHQDAEHPQKILLPKSISSSPKPQKITKRSRSLSTSKTPSQALLEAQRSCLIQELNIQEKVTQSSTKSNNTNQIAISETQTEELAPFTENIKDQSIPSSNQIQPTQFTIVQNDHNCQCSGMKKTMIKVVDRQSSPQPPIDQQPSPKFIAEQHSSLKSSCEKQSSRIGEDHQRISISTVDLHGSQGDLASYQNVMPEPVTDKRLSTKTSPSNFKPAHQPDSINERPTPLVRHENSLPEPHSRDITAGQSKEPNESQKTQLQWILTAPKIVPKPPSTSKQLFQQYGYPQSPFFSVNSTSNTKFQTKVFSGKNSIEVADNHSFLCTQDIINSMPSTSHHEHTSEKLTQMLKLKARQQLSAAKKVKNPVDNKTRPEGMARNIATLEYPPNSIRQLGLPGSSTVVQSAQFAQHHLQQAQIDGLLINDDRYGMRDPCPQGMMNAPASQNLLKLAHQYNPFFGMSHEQQYLPTRDEYLQQYTRCQDMLRRPNMTPTLDQKAYHQNAMMHGGSVIQSQPNPIKQPIHFFSQNVNHYVPINNVYSQEVKSHELIKRYYTDGTHIIYQPIAPEEVNIQFPAYHLSSQSQQDAEHPQKKQSPQNYRDPDTTNIQNGLPLKSIRRSPIPKPQKITKRSRSLPTLKTPSQALLDTQRSCLVQALDIQERVNKSSTKSNNTNLAAISETQTEELASSTENIKVHHIPLSNQIQATQFTGVQNEHNCQCSPMKKTMINQATETDLIMDVSHCVEAIAGSSFSESASRTVESMCQTDEWLEKEEGSLYQETSSDSENTTDEFESENEVVPEANQATLTAEQNLSQENQHQQSRIIVEQDTLDTIGTLFTQMGANLSLTRDMFDGLRNSILVCTQTYKELLAKVDKLNSIEPLQNSAYLPNNVISQATQKIPARGNDYTTSVDNATTSIHEQRGTFSLPPEYDPNDTKWTLKYRENKRGLVELISRTGVYVKKKELKRCIRESNDCRTLARLLLTEVFSQNALRVCSWTGGKAKAFNSVNIDVRPGLDENARMVLLTFVEQHGKKCGWSKANPSAVMSTIRTKINDVRAKYEQSCKVSH
ncbi:uncharacterized protein LOC111002644 isoform X2 [Pieris rapae]|uniref:uncharacterized protein LOC111002644 isoform X2 n=1 Tax=Pieris rapae TaxID=64459 RepID=UPI001E279E45|nr:uncharacterized protein LOC111002644 isoform X2 [Pieris rapae]XP_045490601.1 uncharacterized protein LOC111002644 isoform X2 [Pieris rapae]